MVYLRVADPAGQHDQACLAGQPQLIIQQQRLHTALNSQRMTGIAAAALVLQQQGERWSAGAGAQPLVVHAVLLQR
jgi:hypothetical protein